METASDLHWNSVPYANKINLLSYLSILQNHWEAIKTIIEQPIDDMLAAFFPRLIVSDESKWFAHDDLTHQLQESPRNITLLQQRGIVRLQCGLGLHAYSDGMTLIEILTIAGKYPKTPTTHDDQRYTAELIRLVACMLMNDRVNIEEPMQSCEYYFFQYPRQLYEEAYRILPGTDLHTTYQSCYSLVFDDKSDKVFTRYDDRCLIAMLLLYQSAIESNQDSKILQHNQDSRHQGVQYDKRIVLTLQVYYLIHKDYVTRYTQLQSLPTSIHPHVIITKCLSHTSLIKEYRSGSGNDRDPNTVLRTLFTIRRNEMCKVRVTTDNEKGGFKVVAKKTIDKGEIVMIEQPYCTFSSDYHGDHITCSHCLMTLDMIEMKSDKQRMQYENAFTQCPTCGDYYCSMRCRDTADRLYHHVLCGTGWESFLTSLHLGTCTGDFIYDAVLAFKVMIIAECQGKSIYELPELKILSRPTDTNDESVLTRTTNGPPLWELLPNSDKLICIYKQFRKYCLQLLSRYQLNDFAIVYACVSKSTFGGWTTVCRKDNPQYPLHRSFLLVAASFVNHSCDPNTVSFFDGLHRFHLEAQRAIAEGEEVTMSYLPLPERWDFGTREAHIKSTSGFDCNCSKCKHQRQRK